MGMAPLLKPPADAVQQCTNQCGAMGLQLQSVMLSWNDVYCQCRVNAAPGAMSAPAAPQ